MDVFSPNIGKNVKIYCPIWSEKPFIRLI